MRKTNIVSHRDQAKFIEKDKRLVVASHVRGWDGNWVKVAKDTNLQL